MTDGREIGLGKRAALTLVGAPKGRLVSGTFTDYEWKFIEKILRLHFPFHNHPTAIAVKEIFDKPEAHGFEYIEAEE